MGNVFTKKSTSRQKTCKILNLLPNWFFEPTSRVIINPAVLRICDEVENYYEEEWDSTLDYSIDSLDVKFSEKCKRNRRHTISCCNNNAVNLDIIDNHNDDGRNACSEYSCDMIYSADMEDIKNEIRLLRDQITNLLLLKNVDNIRSSTPSKVANEVYNVKPPPPPPTPIGVNAPKFKLPPDTLLKEITNVKLRPTNVSNEKSRDIRNDLHEILKRRYAVMHSPCQSLIYNEFNDNNNENQLYNLQIQTQETLLIC